MIKSKIILRANGNKEIGLGHIMRLESIELMLNKYFECIFLLREEDVEVASILKNKLIIKIPTQNDLIAESNWIATNCLTGKEIVVLDGYNFDTDYQKTLKANCHGLVYIDDIQNYHYVVDLIINHSNGISKEDFSTESYTRFLLGIKYCILRPDFLNQALNNTTKIPNNKVLVCMGGADPENITLNILKTIVPIWNNYEFNVILGGANPNSDSIRSFSKKYKSLKVWRNLNASEVSNLMSSCSVAILPPSTMSLEYSCSGGSLYTYQIADNQTSINNMLIKEGVAKLYSSLKLNAPEDLHFTRYIQLIDGLSSKRILNEFLSLAC